ARCGRPRASGAAFAVFVLLLVGTGLLVGVPVIPLLGRDAADGYRWLALVPPVLALAVTPPVFTAARRGRPRRRPLVRPGPPPAPPGRPPGCAHRGIGRAPTVDWAASAAGAPVGR